MTTASIAQANYSFNVNTVDKSHHFTYKKAKLGVRTALPLLWTAFPFALIISIYSIKGNVSGFLYNLVFYDILIAGMLVLIMNLFRRKGSFTIAEDGIILKGVKYPYSSIHSMYVKTPKGSKGYTIVQQQATGFGVQSSMHNIGNATTQISAEVGEALKSSIRNKSYKVCILFGEKEKVLASGLTDKTAKVMLEKIDELI